MKAHVVMQVGYEYNDEVYYTPESDGGTPEKAFRNKKKAEELAATMNAKEFSGLEVGSYGYELDEVTKLTQEEVEQRLKDLGLIEKDEEFDFSSFNVPGDLPEDKLREVAKIFHRIVFYEVKEVELED